MSRYTYTINLKHGAEGVIGVDPVARYGYWEYRDGTEGGGLWFDTVPGLYREGQQPTLELSDYDGAYCLPRGVTEALRAAGFTVDDIYLP